MRTIHQNRASAITFLLRIVHGQVAFGVMKYLNNQFLGNLPTVMSRESAKELDKHMMDIKLLENQLCDLQSMLLHKIEELNTLSKRISEEDHAARKST